ncbi:MAG: hypothetical protein H7Y27_10975 [Gemmatimonadaceae bacterium]|nr:hypothetical protein [Chitinophagaceae bacterium]
MIKLSFFVLWLALSSCSPSINEVDLNQEKFCNYFTIKSQSVDILYVDDDRMSDFIKKHYHRFNYLIWDYLMDKQFYWSVKDTALRESKLCADLKSDTTFYNNFRLLTPLRNQSNPKMIYTISEMLTVGSRFFYCDIINRKDTTIGCHICVGINGQRQLVSKKDLTALQAFCFEAVFDNNSKRDRVVEGFSRHVQSTDLLERKTFKNFDDHLQRVKLTEYSYLEKNIPFKDYLLSYYNKHKKTLSFEIR